MFHPTATLSPCNSPAAGLVPSRRLRDHITGCSGEGMAICLLFLLVTICQVPVPALGAQTQPPTPPDFSSPEEVFGATLGMKFSSLGVQVADMARLLEGGTLVIIDRSPASETMPWLATAAIVIDASPSAVYRVLSDVDHYPEFMPQTTSSHAVALTEQIEQVFLEISIHVLLTEVKNEYSLYYYLQPPYRVDWVLAEGAFKANCGSFELVPIPGSPDRTLLLHSSYAMPRNTVINSLFARVPELDLMLNLTTGTLMMESVKRQAEKGRPKGGSSSAGALSWEPADWLRDHASILATLARRGEVFFLEQTSPVVYAGVALLPRPIEESYYASTHLDELSKYNAFFSAKYLEQGVDRDRVEVESVIPLMMEFDAENVLDVVKTQPLRSRWTAEEGGELEGVAGGWELIPQGANSTLAIYWSSSNLESLGFTMRKLLAIEPAFRHGIHIAETQRMVRSLRQWRPSS